MIVPMTNYSVLLFHHDKDMIMEKLMDLGLVQIQEHRAEDDRETQQLASLIRETKDALQRFERRKNTRPVVSKAAHDMIPSLADIQEMEKALEYNTHEAEALAIEIKLLEPWGEFDPDRINRLEDHTNLQVKFFQFPENRFNPEWEKQYALHVINLINGIVYFIILQSPGQELPLSPMALPGTSLSVLKQRRQACIETIETLQDLLDRYTVPIIERLRKRLAEVTDELSLHMGKQNLMPLAEKQLWVVNAWCPVPVENDLIRFLETEKIVYVKSPPKPEDNPPVMLKNNWFVRLFEPIGAMFSLPRYSELDLTLFFAPFFLLFFGLCLGDVGYGVVIVFASTLLKLRKNISYRDYLTLAQVFGVSTIIAGLISGTFFGAEMAHHQWFRQWSDVFLSQDQLFQLALIIGFIQIVFGMGIQAYKLWKFKGVLHALSRIGWIILLLSLGDLYITQLIPGVTTITVWIALALIVFFNAPDSGWMKSFGLGLADLYNITGVLGDLLSYIRLFALGVSSAILGLVVNSIAWSAKDMPYIGIVLYILILVIGHTANLLLSSLSAFVHPMRLTFVEFYKNTGFEGGGKPFIPFARKKLKEHSPQN